MSYSHHPSPPQSSRSCESGHSPGAREQKQAADRLSGLTHARPRGHRSAFAVYHHGHHDGLIVQRRVLVACHLWDCTFSLAIPSVAPKLQTFMSSPVPRRSWLNSRVILWLFGMIAAFAVMYNSLPKKQTVAPVGSLNSQGGIAGGTSSLCENKLAKWIQSVDPERLQFNTDIESRVQELNRYWATCGSKGEDPIVSDLQPIEAALEGAYLERVRATRFERRDVEHIRQSLLLSRMTIEMMESQSADLDRALAAWDLMSQFLEPVASQSATARPLTPFECLLLGEGTSADRAWIFAEVLRQLHLDAVVLTTEDSAIPPLVGVIIQRDVYLFDSHSGWPVPAAGESQRKTIYREPATLQAALADDTVLRQLDLEGAPFPWTSVRLQAAKIGLVGTSSTWSPRLAELQFQWPNGQPCLIYDGLGASAGRERGLVERVNLVLSSLGLDNKHVHVWDYPEQQCALYNSLGSEAAEHMLPLVAVMSGPTTFEEVQDPKTKLWSVYSKRTNRALQQARVQQLLGDQTEAIQGYLPMLRAHLAAPKLSGKIDSATQAAMDRNRIVSDKATYWMAATQFEDNELKACVDTLKRYARDFPLGEMREAAAMRLAASFLRSQQFDPALQVLDKIGPGPNQTRKMLLARRLLELSPQPSPPPETPPTDPSPAPSVTPP